MMSASYCEIAPRLMSQNTFDDKSTPVRLMLWDIVPFTSANVDLYLFHMASLGHNQL